MNAVSILPSAPVVQPWKIDASRGTSSGRVSSEWFSRPDDQRFVSLNDLFAFTKRAADSSDTNVIDVRQIRVVAESDKPEDLFLDFVDSKNHVMTAKPTHWSFGQACALVKAPAAYLRQLPATIAGINLQYGIANYRGELMKLYSSFDGIGADSSAELRAITSPTYGRIPDHEVVAAVQKIAGDGIGDTRWKIPGVINWQNQTYDPLAPITRESTTLFASDRDVFMFLVDDTHPIEIGKLSDGSPDLIFRGFYAWNSEVGAKSFGLACFYMRGACQNRCIWGIEGYEELSFRHSAGAPDRFMKQADRALQQFTSARTDRLIEGVKLAKATEVAADDDAAKSFLSKHGLTKAKAQEVIDTVLREEGRPARSVWDIVQGITAVARKEGHQDARLDMERIAGGVLNKIK